MSAQGDDQADGVLTSGPPTGRLQDLPLCFPGRDCHDVPPGGAQAMYLIADLTPSSSAIAAIVWAWLGASLVLIGLGLRDHRRGVGSSSKAVLLAIGQIVSGALVSWLINAWLGEAAVVYGGADGRPAETTPSTVIVAWPLVQAAAHVAIGLGAVALLVALNTAAVHRRRALREEGARLG